MSSSKNHVTDRSRRMRSLTTHKRDERLLDNVEEHGLHIIHVMQLACPLCQRKAKCNLNWSYTIGIHDTLGKPEIIQIGLLPETAKFAMNKAAKRIRAGADLMRGRQIDLVGSVECELRLVDPKWVAHLMNFARWYYESTDIPTVQLVYPDLENRFQWEPDFTERFRQPLLQTDAPFGPLEKAFWEDHEFDAEIPEWKLPTNRNKSVFVSQAVLDGEPITYASRESDGDWQLTGDSGAEGDPIQVCFYHLVEQDSSLEQLADLPLGWCAEREAIGKRWVRSAHD